MKYNNHFKLLTICLILSGCSKKHSKPLISDSKAVNSGYSKGEKKIYDEDLEAFVLEEDANSLTSDLGQESLIADESDSALMVDDHKDSSKYGLKTIYFDFDKYNIKPDQKDALESNLKIIKNLTSQGKKIVIEGHADSSAGSSEYNMVLSEKRSLSAAKEIEKYLVKNGVKKSMIKTVGRGYEMPIVMGGNREQQAPNRRVEFYVLEKK